MLLTSHGNLGNFPNPIPPPEPNRSVNPMGSVKQRARESWANLSPSRCSSPIRESHAGALRPPTVKKPAKTAIETQNAEAICSRRSVLTGVSPQFRDENELPETNPLHNHSLFYEKRKTLGHNDLRLSESVSVRESGRNGLRKLAAVRGIGRESESALF